MKKAVVFFSCLLVFSSVFGQTGFEFAAMAEDSSDNFSYRSVIEQPSGGYIVLGVSGDFYQQNNGILLFRLDSHGQLVDTASIHHPDYSIVPRMIFPVSDSNLFVLARAIVLNTGEEKLWMGTFTSDFQLVSESLISYNFPGIRNINGFRESDSTIVITGWCDGFATSYMARINYVSNDAFFVHYDNFEIDLLFDILPRKDSAGYVVLGDSEYYLTNENFEISRKIEKTISTPYSPHLTGSLLDDFSDSTYLFTAIAHFPPGNIDTSAFLVGRLMSDSLVIQKLQLIGIATYPSDSLYVRVYPAFSNSLAKNTGFVFAGGTKNFEINENWESKFILGKYDISLNKVWEKEFGEDSVYYFMSGLIATSDGGCLMYGRRRQYLNDYPREAYILKVDKDGLITGEVSIPLPEPLLVYPNPAQDYIQCKLPDGYPYAQLYVMDISGRVVLTKPISDRERIDVSFLPAGMYLFQVFDPVGKSLGAGKLIKE